MRANRYIRSAPIASALVLAVGVPGAAQADVLASAVLAVTNARLVIAGTDTKLTNGTEINITGGGNTANVSADLTSVAGGPQTGSQTSTLAPFDLAQVSEGTAPVANDDFTPFTNPVDPTAGKLQVNGNFAMADMALTGAIVNLPGQGITDDAAAFVRADSYLSQTDFGDASSNVSTGTSFSFTLTDPLSVQLVADFQGDAEAWASADTIIPASATPSYSFTFNVFDSVGTSVVPGGAWAPFAAQSATRDSGNVGKTTLSNAVSAISPIVPLTPGLYSISIRQTAEADTANAAAAVPTPAPLALLAAGLAMLGATTRLRSKKAAQTS